jgi:hypothetical protein
MTSQNKRPVYVSQRVGRRFRLLEAGIAVDRTDGTIDVWLDRMPWEGSTGTFSFRLTQRNRLRTTYRPAGHLKIRNLMKEEDMKRTVGFPIASIVVSIGSITLLPHVRIPLIYDSAYRVGAWIGRTYPPGIRPHSDCGLSGTKRNKDFLPQSCNM